MKTLKILIVILAFLALAMLPFSASAQTADMDISKSASAGAVTAGNTFSYTITIVNNGDALASNVSVTDTFDANIDFVSSSPGVSSLTVNDDGQTVATWNLGNYSAGQSTVITVTADTPSNISSDTTVLNSASVSGTNFAADQSNTVAVVIDQPNPVVSVSKMPSSGTVSAGETFTYTIRITNTGGATASGISITDRLDADTTLVSAVPTPSISADGGAVNTWNVSALGAGETFTIITQVRVDADASAGEIIENNVSVTGNNFADVNADSFLTVGPIPTPTPTPVPPTPTPAVPTPTPGAFFEPGVLGGEELPTTGISPLMLVALAASAGILFRWLGKKHPFLGE